MLSITSCSRRSAGTSCSDKVSPLSLLSYSERQQRLSFPLTLNFAANRLHVCTAERHPLPGQDVRLRQLDLLPLQSLRQRHQGARTGNSLKPWAGGWMPVSHWLHLLIQISIPVVSVTFIKKTKTALLVPNALVIETKSYQVRTHFVFMHFVDQSTWLLLIWNDVCFLACVCVLPLAKYNLQVPQVHLHSSWGEVFSLWCVCILFCMLFLFMYFSRSKCVKCFWVLCNTPFNGDSVLP